MKECNKKISLQNMEVSPPHPWMVYETSGVWFGFQSFYQSSMLFCVILWLFRVTLRLFCIFSVVLHIFYDRSVSLSGHFMFFCGRFASVVVFCTFFVILGLLWSLYMSLPWFRVSLLPFCLSLWSLYVSLWLVSHLFVVTLHLLVED